MKFPDVVLMLSALFIADVLLVSVWFIGFMLAMVIE